MKKGLAILAVLLIAAIVFQPVKGNAESELDKINKELANVRKQMDEAAQNRQKAEENKAQALALKDETAKSVTEIISQLNEVGGQLADLQSQIDNREQKLAKAGADLDATEKRIEERDRLLDSRIRLMYTNGIVSYLDVLMSSTSFADFLDRFDSLKSILGQDQQILAGHKKDKELLEKQKASIQNSLAEVKGMYAKLDDYHELLNNKEKQKEVMILQYKSQAEESEEISEEAQQQTIDLAKKFADLKNKQEKMKTYYSGGKLGMPLKTEYRLSSPFGYRIHPITGERKLHTGMDMAVPKGTPIYAAESGVVILAQWSSGYGNCVIIDHGGGLWTVYGHIMNGGILVKQGETVKRGDKIAQVGSTGDSTGNHLHFEVRLNEKAVNPAPYLK